MATADELGSLVLKQKPTYAPAIALISIGILLLSLGTIIALGAQSWQFLAALGGPGAVCLAVGVLLFRRHRRYGVSLYERGIRETRDGVERMLPYGDVEEISFRTTRIMVHGVYAGTVEELSLQSADLGRKPIKFRNEYKDKTGSAESPTPVRRLSDSIAEEIALRKTEQLRRGGRLSCGPRLAVTSGGIELPNRADGGAIGWNQISRHELNLGKFRLFLKGDSKPALEISTGAPNFWPFYRILLRHAALQ